MKQIIATLLLLTMMTPCLRAQRKELSQARSYIKSRKNYDKAEQLMTGLLADSAMRSDKRIYQVWFEAVKGQFDQANERLYLKQRQDTAAFFELNRRLFTIAESLDSIDARPDKKGRVSPDYRQKHATMLNGHRPNLFNGGTYHIRKGNWQKGYELFDAYIDCAQQPLFTNYDLATADKRLPEAAYWATYCGFRLNDPARTLHHCQMALLDTLHADFTMQFMAEAYKGKSDTIAYVSTLEQGFSRYPQNPYFFPRLIDIYTEKARFNEALAIIDTALSKCDTCELFLFAKSATLLRLNRWEESLAYSQRIIMQNDTLPEPYFNAAMASINLADSLNDRRERSQAKSYYQRARTYMEFYRQLMPGEQKKWAPVLYRIYLNLNLGRQFDEIDRLLKSP